MLMGETDIVSIVSEVDVVGGFEKRDMEAQRGPRGWLGLGPARSGESGTGFAVQVEIMDGKITWIFPFLGIQRHDVQSIIFMLMR